MFTTWLTQVNAAQLLYTPISLLGQCGRKLIITTDGRHAIVTSGQRKCEMSWLAYKAIHDDRGSANSHSSICGMHEHVMRSLRDRYEVKYLSLSTVAMISRAEATSHGENSSPLYRNRLNPKNNQSSSQSSNHDYSWARRGELKRN
jgi:hypothetical protein